MPDLLIRDLDPGLRRQLEERAKAHGRSLSEEAKSLIRRSLAEPTDAGLGAGLGSRLFSLLPDAARGDDLVFDVQGGSVEPPDFS